MEKEISVPEAKIPASLKLPPPSADTIPKQPLTRPEDLVQHPPRLGVLVTNPDAFVSVPVLTTAAQLTLHDVPPVAASTLIRAGIPEVEKPNKWKTATKVIQQTRLKRQVSELFGSVLKTDNTEFAPVAKTYLTWLDIEKKLEAEYQNIQESSFMIMMKQKVSTGEGERAGKSVGVNPFTDNRVILSKLEEEAPETNDSTFYNASYIDGLLEKDYIACAMPHNATSQKDFWRMVWEQKTSIIVMLNSEEEQGLTPYWPTKVNTPIDSGLFTLTLLETTKLMNSPDCLVRKIKIHWKKEDKDRTVLHFQYKEWPDMGIPQEKGEFLKWVAHVDSVFEEKHKAMGPVIVHCFGGVGRTGTFLTIHSTLQKLKRQGGRALEVDKILGLMRHKRAALVQTVEQYKLCYRILLELYEARRNLVGVLAILKPKD